MPNRLTQATSPYLLQHADNPVDWYPWDEEALEKARREDRPIFLSIGYAACHWCHVMAHESFEDAETAALMNEHFVSIKVDREERPDLDAIYMQAVVALTGSGGWPMSVFLTPDLRPFFGGTYYPPRPRHGLPSFRQVLTGLADAWRTRRDEVDRVGEQLSTQLQAQAEAAAPAAQVAAPDLEAASRSLCDTYDWAHGGWGMAPKFPQPMAVGFLLRRAVRGDEQGGKVALHCLEAMSRGGMYDVVGGGFARYATDNHWRVPHFEKMLYDNALLAEAYLHAWLFSGQAPFRRVCEETLDFVARELTGPEGGFYSSLDADSEGEEGRYYVWTKEEIHQALADGEDFDFFATAYGVTERGNWEGRTVLQRALDDGTLAARFSLDAGGVPDRLAACHARLLQARERRARPGTDDKVLTAWNGLMLSALAQAARYLDSQEYLELARSNARFLLTALRPDGQLRRAWRAGRTTGEVFLEDYAALILGLLELYQTEFDPGWYTAAEELAGEMVERFSDSRGGFFDVPSAGARDLLVRPKDLQDNATPSGNALAVEALLKLDAFSGRTDWRELAEGAFGPTVQAAARYPTAFSRWLSAMDFALGPVKQAAVVADSMQGEWGRMMGVLRAALRPNLVVAAALSPPPPPGAPALLDERPALGGKATAYLCEGFVCRRPVTEADALRLLLD
jgi:uncharacterized protein